MAAYVSLRDLELFLSEMYLYPGLESSKKNAIFDDVACLTASVRDITPGILRRISLQT